MSDTTPASTVDVGRVGIWSLELRGAAPADMTRAAAGLHDDGWGALWIAGAGGPGIWGDTERLLSAGTGAAVALGVVSMWGADGRVAAREHARLADRFPHRLLTGLGVSDPNAAAAAGAAFGSPLATMSAYLDAMDAGSPTIPSGERLLGALGPRMVTLAGRRTAGIHPFLVPPEASTRYRELVGPAGLVAPHQAVVLERDAARAREIARNGIGMFIGFPSYQANLRRFGFTDADLVPGGSDRLIDALVAWGDVDDVAERVAAHHAAGADHVALHVLSGERGLPLAQWRALDPLAREQRELHQQRG